MGEIILPKAVKREPGYLYYVDKEGNICRTKMARRGKKKEPKEPTKFTIP